MLWFSESNDRSGLVRMTTARRSQKMVTWQFVGSEMDEFPHLFLYGCLCLCIIYVKTAAMFDIKDRCQEIKFGMFFVVCVCVRVKKWQQTHGPMGTNEHNVMIKVSSGSFESRCCSIKKASQKSTMFAFANWNRFFPFFSSHSSQCRYRYFFWPWKKFAEFIDLIVRKLPSSTEWIGWLSTVGGYLPNSELEHVLDVIQSCLHTLTAVRVLL